MQHLLLGFAIRGYHFAQPPAIKSLSLSSASHPIPTECNLCVVGTMSDVCRISTGNIASLLSVRVFADAVSGGVFANRGYHFVQPPVIESLSLSGASHPIQSEFHAMCSSKKLLHSLYTLNSILSSLHSSLFTLNFSLRRWAGSLDTKTPIGFFCFANRSLCLLLAPCDAEAYDYLDGCRIINLTSRGAGRGGRTEARNSYWPDTRHDNSLHSRTNYHHV